MAKDIIFWCHRIWNDIFKHNYKSTFYVGVLDGHWPIKIGNYLSLQYCIGFCLNTENYQIDVKQLTLVFCVILFGVIAVSTAELLPPIICDDDDLDF